MTSAQTDEPTAKKPLRLWPGVILAVLLLVVRFGVPIVAPGAMAFAMLGGLVGALAILVWWAFFSRAPRPDRWGGLILMIVALAVTPRLLHASIGTGNMGLQFFMYAVPVLGLAEGLALNQLDPHTRPPECLVPAVGASVAELPCTAGSRVVREMVCQLQAIVVCMASREGGATRSRANDTGETLAGAHVSLQTSLF